MSDIHDEKAAELLPHDEDSDYCNLPLHTTDCPAYYRPAVAAALRAKDAEIATLERELVSGVAELRAQLAAAEESKS